VAALAMLPVILRQGWENARLVVRPRLSLRAGTRNPKCSAGAQEGDQLAFERSTTLDEQRLVDRLVADPHGLIIGEVDFEPVSDLLRAPGRGPSTVTTVRLVATGP
jgi:hypothetical protein